MRDLRADRRSVVRISQGMYTAQTLGARQHSGIDAGRDDQDVVRHLFTCGRRDYLCFRVQACCLNAQAKIDVQSFQVCCTQQRDWLPVRGEHPFRDRRFVIGVMEFSPDDDDRACEIVHAQRLGNANVNLTTVYLATNTRLVLGADNLAEARAALG